jgi:hypothetical protein
MVFQFNDAFNDSSSQGFVYLQTNTYVMDVSHGAVYEVYKGLDGHKGTS